MGKEITLLLSDKAAENLKNLSKTLNISHNEFASLCFEYVDIKHQGISAAAAKIKQKKDSPKVAKKDLSKHLKKLSAEQIELLLRKAAQKNKN